MISLRFWVTPIVLISSRRSKEAMTRNNISMGCSRRQASRNKDRFARRLRSNRITISLRVRGNRGHAGGGRDGRSAGYSLVGRLRKEAVGIAYRRGCQDTFATRSPAPTGGNAFSPAMAPIQQRSPSHLWIGSTAVKRSMRGPVEINGLSAFIRFPETGPFGAAPGSATSKRR